MTSRFRHRGVKAIPAVVILLLYGAAAGLAGAEDQIGNFAGSGASVGYLPGRLTVAVVTTYTPEAFDNTTGSYKNASAAILGILGNALAPNALAISH